MGKSTLLNCLTASDRAIVSPIPGTTRDAVDEVVERNGQRFRFIDTAGIRRKGKTHLMAEKLSVVMARKHLEAADIALLVIDATAKRLRPGSTLPFAKSALVSAASEFAFARPSRASSAFLPAAMYISATVADASTGYWTNSKNDARSFSGDSGPTCRPVQRVRATLGPHDRLRRSSSS